MPKSKFFILALIVVLIFGFYLKSVFAQDSSVSVLYVPLIGITSVPNPLALPKGAGNVTYNYAVKNFLSEVPLTDVKVIDNNCNPIKFIGGDDNHDSKLDYSETWRYACTAKLPKTTESVATATGSAFGLLATHNAYATVVVGSNAPAPLVSIVNITKVAYPLSLPIGGGDITFTYKVNNPGEVALSGVSVVDDKCKDMSGKLGDTNGNNLLDTNEVWIYRCTTHLSQTTTNTASVTSYANGFKAVGYAILTVEVAIPSNVSSPSLPSTGEGGTKSDIKITVWEIMAGVLVALVLLFIIIRKNKRTWIQ